mmetsp:Transcript_54543/g.65783  ORF Transcript_54543/g.65783 Transcript_54543/m.65783 type:complete len:95 (-) Transcript_54543:1567-1851(-)
MEATIDSPAASDDVMTNDTLAEDNDMPTTEDNTAATSDNVMTTAATEKDDQTTNDVQLQAAANNNNVCNDYANAHDNNMNDDAAIKAVDATAAN